MVVEYYGDDVDVVLELVDYVWCDVVMFLVEMGGVVVVVYVVFYGVNFVR